VSSDQEPGARDLDALLGRDGAVARALTASGQPHEDRPQQREMAQVVLEGLSSRRHVVVEAGTGVGKSFAYLVPALLWAHRTGARVAVATSTIALQEQLVHKDLPLLHRALPFSFEHALVKGRGNYLCTRRLHLALEAGGALFADEERRGQLEAIRAWGETDPEGSRQTLPFRARDEVWEEVNAERGNCLQTACPHFARCHYQNGRRRAKAARLLVLNHHVLLSDLALRRSGHSFLPDVDAIVVDEAHDLEDTAAQHLGARLSGSSVAWTLGRLWGRRGKGLLARVGNARAREAVESAREAATLFFEQLAGALGADERGARAISGSMPADDVLSPRLSDVAAALEVTRETAGERDLALEAASRARVVRDLVETIGAFAAAPPPDEVRWIETAGRSVALCSAPLDVGARLKEVLWDRVDTVVLTSATLTAGSPPSFEYLRRRLGLTDAIERTVGSPFAFERQARLRVRTDLPDPVRDPRAYEQALPDAVLEAVRATRGGALVLFTSYGSLRGVADAIRPALEADGLEVLVQGGDLERAALLERFRGGDAVLMGVSSFWQGVDVPGDALRHVVIARLPFDVPTHPLQQARHRWAQREGRDAFEDLALPAAMLRLKQGFGRLIRRASDRGTVTILDPRVVTRAYGRALLAGLPRCPVEHVP
jgi:ATP-dependent DNA helicase DinG